ncbi:hypothetical protein KEM60_01507 [Austwickia sp. TVS 96-490-7B]|uniref:PH domain-containing protein n=1 Tax=Austwickia sp. TVS 96-490-7B TaxID=2830843 RepID=UPI001DE1D469|nr:PH domain-containing protein [Austwickia sp. TVS 96-490-7B]MBW3085310.1 hypothetical protein [Austwickia sp. TVS 96-490-7B]
MGTDEAVDDEAESMTPLATAEPGQVRQTVRRPAHRVSPRAPWMWLVSTAVGWLCVLVPCGAVWWFVESSRGWMGWVCGGGALWAVVHCAVMPPWRYLVHRWEVDDTAVYTLEGWFTQRSRVAPVSRIQTVDSRYGPVQRLFGLGTVQVTTASAAGPLDVDGLPRAQVEELVARLTAVTARGSGDAT